MLWDWNCVKTFSWKIKTNFIWIKEEVEILFIEWNKDDMPVVWIEFLKQNKNKLNLDFENNIFELK